MMAYTVGTGFSGIGTPDLAARLLGMTIQWQIEKNEYCQRVLRKNFPEVPQLVSDIFDAHDLAHVDIAVFGFPCQPFSIAGSRLGVKDERYLVPEMMRVLAEVKPRVALLENVPGFTSIDDGNAFKQLLQALAGMGYDAEWGHIAASDFNAPHIRERWWLVAYAVGAGRQPGAPTCGRNIRQQLRNPTPTQRGRQQLKPRTSAPSRRISKPGLRRNADGLADWLDRLGEWPAPRNEPQKSWEPPRSTSVKAPYRDERLEALGNSMAFPVVYAILANIQLWLQSQDEAALKQTA